VLKNQKAGLSRPCFFVEYINFIPASQQLTPLKNMKYAFDILHFQQLAILAETVEKPQNGNF
jgi:hypothetical protein